MGSINSNNDVPFAMNRNILKGEMNRYRSNPNHMGTAWTDVLSFNISVIKDPCIFPEYQEAFFTEEEVDEINKWLTSPDYPIVLHMYDYEYKDSKLTECLPENNYWFTVANYWEKDEYDPQNYKVCSSEPVFSDMQETGYYKVIWDGKIYYCDVKYSEDHDSYYIGNISILREKFETYVDTGEPFVVLANDGIFRSVYVSDATNNIMHRISAEYSPKKHHHLTEYDYYGLFTNVSPQVIAGEVIGFDMTFITNSPFAWTHLKSERFWCDNQQDDGVELHLRVDHSEQNREVYPVIIIKNWNSDQTVAIKCQTDNAKVTRLHIDSRNEVVIDCRRAMIYDALGLFSFDDLGIADVDYIYWPKIYDGLNRIIVCGEKLEVTFQWREARKVGAY